MRKVKQITIGDALWHLQPLVAFMHVSHKLSELLLKLLVNLPSVHVGSKFTSGVEGVWQNRFPCEKIGEGTSRMGEVSSSEPSIHDQSGVDCSLDFIAITRLVPVGHDPEDTFPQA
jgi:hypothetical protein